MCFMLLQSECAKTITLYSLDLENITCLMGSIPIGTFIMIYYFLQSLKITCFLFSQSKCTKHSLERSKRHPKKTPNPPYYIAI